MEVCAVIFLTLTRVKTLFEDGFLASLYGGVDVIGKGGHYRTSLGNEATNVGFVYVDQCSGGRAIEPSSQYERGLTRWQTRLRIFGNEG